MDKLSKISKNKTKITYPVFDKQDSFLLCSLFTLAPNQKLFKKLDLHKKFYIRALPSNGILNNKEFLIEYYSALNQKSIRQLAYTLLSPYFLNNYNRSQSLTLNSERINELDLLKKYLKKFQYTYFRYFFPINDKLPLPSTNKELNTKAINALFLIVGV